MNTEEIRNSGNHQESDHNENAEQDDNLQDQIQYEINKQKLLESTHQGGLQNSHVTEPFTEKQARFEDMYDTVAPHLQSQAVQDLRQTVNLTLDTELEKYIFQLENTQKRFQDLEREKAKLANELNFWKSKADEAESNKQNDQNFVEQITNDQLVVIENAHNFQIEFLELEKQKYEKALKEKLDEAEEWKMKAAEYEEKFLTSNRIQFELQSLERRIQELIDANAFKSQELEDTRLIVSQIEITKADIRKLEEELHTAKEMLDFHVSEGIQLKAACDALAHDNAAGRDLYARLKENELRLKNAINDLTRQMHNMIAFKDAQLKDIQVRGELLLNNIQNKQNLEKQNINTHKHVLEVTIGSRQNDINQMGLINSHIDKEIRDTVTNADNLKIEADSNHIRADSAELEKRRTIELEHQTQINEINKLNRDQDYARSVLGGHINTLNRNIHHKHSEVVNTAVALDRTEHDKHNRALEKNDLERRLNGWMVHYDVTRKNQEIELRNRTVAQNQQLNNVAIVGKVQEAGLKETVNNNAFIYEDHKLRTEDALRRNNHFHAKLVDTVNTERQLSNEAHHWLRTSQEIERVKNIELSNSLERKRVDVNHLNNAIHFERDTINRHNLNLVHNINIKESQNSNIKLNNNQTFNALNNTVHESIILNQHSHNFKNATDLNKRQSLHESIVHENITRSQINNLNNVRNSEKSAIVNDINKFKQAATVNSNNANLLRHSLSTTLRAPYIRYIHH